MNSLNFFISFIIFRSVECDSEVYRLLRVDTNVSTTTDNPDNIPSHSECKQGDKCCFMYTWPGSEWIYEKSQEFAPRFCEDIKDKNVPCFEPLIYANESKKRPNVTQARCRDNNLICSCNPSSGTCMKISILFNDKTVKNETLFCGSLTNVGTNENVKEGCYTEKLEGTSLLREVCACDPAKPNNEFCNSTVKLNSTIIISLVEIFILLMYQVN